MRVTSISALLTALANDSIGDIVVANGTYHVSTASSMRSDSLWIGKRFAGRTRPVLIRAETRGGVTFDGGGSSSYGGMTIIDGAHDQIWDGFNFANMVGGHTGIIVFGGDPTLPPPHHITLRNFTLKSTLRRESSSSNKSQGVYFAHARGRARNNLLIEDLNIQGTNSLSLWSGIHAYHGDSSHPPASNVTIRPADGLRHVQRRRPLEQHRPPAQLADRRGEHHRIARAGGPVRIDRRVEHRVQGHGLDRVRLWAASTARWARGHRA